MPPPRVRLTGSPPRRQPQGKQSKTEGRGGRVRHGGSGGMSEIPPSDGVGPHDGAAPLLLEIADVTMRFGGIVALEDVTFAVERRPHRRPDRSERRRQDHAVQLPEPALPAGARRHPAGRPVACAAARPPTSPPSASGAPSRPRPVRLDVGPRQRQSRRPRPRPQRPPGRRARPCPRRATRGARIRRDRARHARLRRPGSVAERPAASLSLGARKRVELARALAADRSSCCSTSRPAASITRKSLSSAP